MKLCCKEMEEHVRENEIQIHYDSTIRFYAIPYKPRRGGGMQAIHYCPWCGKKLPKDLDEERSSILEQVVGENWNLYNLRKIPKEFKTDEWWKNRGL